jgi:hypothetical protein
VSYYLSYRPHQFVNKANNLTVTGVLEINVRQAFKAGIKYLTPEPLMSTSGRNQPRTYIMRYLQQTFSTTTIKKNEIDKTYIPAYFYLGGAGTGKSRHASEFVSLVQQAIALHGKKHPLYHQLAQRLKRAVVFHVSFENGTPLGPEELSNPWNAIGIRMLRQLLDEDIDDIHDRYVASRQRKKLTCMRISLESYRRSPKSPDGV